MFLSWAAASCLYLFLGLIGNFVENTYGDPNEALFCLLADIFVKMGVTTMKCHVVEKCSSGHVMSVEKNVNRVLKL